MPQPSAWTLWYLGYPDQGLAQSQEAVTLAQQIAHPFSLSFALSSAAMFHQFRREVRAAQERAEAAISLATEQGFPHLDGDRFYPARLGTGAPGQAQEGIEQMHQGLRAFRATGAEIIRPYCLALLAEAHGTIGTARGRTHGARGSADACGHNWRTVVRAELYRLKGALLLQQSSDNPLKRKPVSSKPLTIAQNQQAKSLELRAATSLARLWQQQGKRQEAHDLLAPVYQWFTEGFDTADLKDAKALLDELA